MAYHSAISDIGLRRANNEDAFFCAPDHGVYVVADGVGGQAGGEDASQLTTDVFEAHAPLLAVVAQAYATNPSKQSGLDVFHALEKVCQEANSLVYAMAWQRGQVGSSTTLVACVVAGDAVFVAHVGDSRAYMSRAGLLFPLTTDHSFVNQLVQQGKITPQEARRHPRRNVITRAVGSKPRCSPGLRVVQLQAGDRLLLATDGLTDMVDDDTIGILVADADLDRASRHLVSAALENGGRDNITVALVEPGSGPLGAPGDRQAA